MAGFDSPVERLRRSVELTAAEGTARVRFSPHRIIGRSFESVLAETSSARTVAAFGFAKRAVKLGLSVLPASAIGGEFPSGEIDFTQQRCLYNAGTFWKLFAPGLDFVGQPGEWEADEHDGIGLDEPFWLLELIKATVEAVDEGIESVGGEDCRHYAARADFALATSDAGRAMVSPLSSDELNLARLEIDIWLDGQTRIRRATFRDSRSMTTLELFGFGEPAPIELPRPEEIIPEVPVAASPPRTQRPGDDGAQSVASPGLSTTRETGETRPTIDEAAVPITPVSSVELLVEVQGATERTMSARTARLIYEADVETIGLAPLVDAIAAHEPDPTVTGVQRKAWSLVGRGIKAGDSALSRMATGISEGVIDFESGGSLVSRQVIGRDRARYYAPGVQLTRDRPGGPWRERPRRPFEGSRAYTPMWLTELPRGATDVTLLGEEHIDGDPCQHVRGTADVELAARGSRHGMETTFPGHPENDPLPFEAWLDQDGRLRRVRHVVTTWACEIRLSRFGEVPPLEPPPVAG